LLLALGKDGAPASSPTKPLPHLEAEDLPGVDDLDHALHLLPIWRLGYAHIVTEIEITPLCPYENRAEDLKNLSKRLSRKEVAGYPRSTCHLLTLTLRIAAS